MSVSSGGRRPSKKLSPELKWEIFLKIVSGEVTQSDAARKNGVDVSTIIALRRCVKDASLAALSRAPGRPRVERNFELEAARVEIAQLTEAVKSMAIELAIVREKRAGARRAAAGAGPRRREISSPVHGGCGGGRRVRSHLGVFALGCGR